MSTLIGLLTGLAAAVIVLYFRRQQQAFYRTRESRPARCQRCGYDLSHLEFPRCPECGTLRSFRVPLTELGLTEEEMRKGFEKRQKGRTDIEP